jgi:hypothetical protein
MRLGEVPDPIDQTVRKTHVGEDDKAFARARAKKRETTPRFPLPSGPCCFRCPHWTRDEDEEYGACRVLFVAWASRPENRRIVGYDEVRMQGIPVTDNLRTMPHFVCDQFGRSLTKPLLKVVQPDKEPLPEWGPLKSLLRSRDDRRIE